MDKSQLSELLLQALTHEEGCVRVYGAALGCASNPDLGAEWTESLHETERHVLILTLVCDTLGIDPGRRTEGCRIAAQLSEALEKTLLSASRMADREEAQRVACDCLVLAETRHHASWSLIAHCAESHRGPEARVLKSAVEHVESEVSGKLSRARGWCRELWLDSLWSSRPATDASLDTTLEEWASADSSGVRAAARGRAA
ncbi:MAG: hypothetical protein J0L92_39280 [Deltaproteobacteria bacterium]|nr:hypothetical protein [Deltaproteobacteria bacterium]